MGTHGVDHRAPVPGCVDRGADPLEELPGGGTARGGDLDRWERMVGVGRGEDPVLVMNRPLLPPLIDGRRVVRLAEKYDSMIEEENFYLYRIRRDVGPSAP